MLARLDDLLPDAARDNPMSRAEEEATLRDFREFMDDPIRLMQRALDLLSRKRNEVATWLFFGVLAGHLVYDFTPAAISSLA